MRKNISSWLEPGPYLEAGYCLYVIYYDSVTVGVRMAKELREVSANAGIFCVQR